MEEEIKSQTESLPRFASQLRKDPEKKVDPSRTVFTGSGDSYAAALFAQELSEKRATGSDPYELLRSIERVREKSLVIISASGKTRTNLALARRSKRIALERVAITANASSPLAGACDRVVLLNYPRSDVLTSGTTSFTTGLLACASIIGKLPRTFDIGAAYEQSLRWVQNVTVSDKGSILFVGSGICYAMALYGAAKIHEVLGTKAEADYPEQIGHAHLFSVDAKHDTVICIYSNHDKTSELEKNLEGNGFKAVGLRVPVSDPTLRSVKIAFHLQQLALLQAKRRKLRECAFRSDKKRLALSSRLIY